MAERPGTDKARLLYNSSDLKIWNTALTDYKTAVNAISAAKKKSELIKLDDFRNNLLSFNVNLRSPQHITGSELSDIIKWKLLRGKFRPLQKLVDGNKNALVIATSQKSFKLLANKDWKGALETLMTLHGIGVASASAVLALLSPELCPFMADEVIEVTTGRRDYTMTTYEEMQDCLVKRASKLGGKWTAELVGKSLWTVATLHRYAGFVPGDPSDTHLYDQSTNEIIAKDEDNTQITKTKRRRSEVEIDNLNSSKKTKL